MRLSWRRLVADATWHFLVRLTIRVVIKYSVAEVILVHCDAYRKVGSSRRIEPVTETVHCNQVVARVGKVVCRADQLVLEPAIEIILPTGREVRSVNDETKA